MSACLEDDGNGGFAIRGELNVESVAALWSESKQRFQGLSVLRIDLTGVSRSDSSGVALLVEWLRQAREAEQELKLVNIPEQMQAIIQVTDLDGLLPLA